MKTATGIVLIHGAGLGSFVWQEVVPLLEGPVLTAHFPSEKSLDASVLSFGDYVDCVVRQIEESGLENFVLVTHSIGGCVGLKVAEHFGARVVGFVAISAAIPSSGDSYISCLPGFQRVVMRMILYLLGTKPPQGVLTSSLCNDLTPEQTNRVLNNFIPEASALYTGKCGAQIPDTRRMYIRLTEDKGFPVQWQDASIQVLRPHVQRSMASGHLPMISEPQKLASMLNEFYNLCDLEINPMMYERARL